jgi:hypothetical protein
LPAPIIPTRKILPLIRVGDLAGRLPDSFAITGF